MGSAVRCRTPRPWAAASATDHRGKDSGLVELTGARARCATRDTSDLRAPCNAQGVRAPSAADTGRVRMAPPETGRAHATGSPSSVTGTGLHAVCVPVATTESPARRHASARSTAPATRAASGAGRVHAPLDGTGRRVNFANQKCCQRARMLYLAQGSTRIAAAMGCAAESQARCRGIAPVTPTMVALPVTLYARVPLKGASVIRRVCATTVRTAPTAPCANACPAAVERTAHPACSATGERDARPSVLVGLRPRVPFTARVTATLACASAARGGEGRCAT